MESYGTKSTLICSLTKAAASEMMGRDIPIAKEMVGTLHAHCYRALGCPDLAEVKVNDWNKEHPAWSVSQTVKGGVDDPKDTGGGDNEEGDYLMSRMNICRAAMSPIAAETPSVQSFYEAWTEWKEINGLLDFTDLIEACIEEGGSHPSKPDIMLGDEAQDWSKLEFKLFCEIWGAHADTLVLAGDFDQTLYSWRGADSQYFIDNPVPEENLKILKQSYRVPVMVHEKAHRWIRTATDRMDVDYLPADRTGMVRRRGADFKDHKNLVDDVIQTVVEGRSCMILATCAYMLQPVIYLLRGMGVPFGNLYRKANMTWNPMSRKKDARMPINRVESFLAPRLQKKNTWSKEEFASWMGCLRSKDKLRHGAKTIINNPDYVIPANSMGELNQLFATIEDTEAAVMLDTKWFRDSLLKKYEKTVGYILNVFENYGDKYMTQAPPVTVGTIHSVKGGEADVVYLFPDLSWKGKEGYESHGERRNSVIRTFYVGMTRAKDELVICDPSSNLSVEI